MNLSNISLPYPVLGINDDVSPELPQNAISVELSADKFNYKFIIVLHFDNADIKKLIEGGYADYSCEYECTRTMLRRCEKSKEPQFEIVLPRDGVRGRLSFNCFVSVKKPIENYRNRGFNEDYKGVSFNMEPGDILVAFPQAHYDADIKYDKLQAAGSFMQIREDKRRNDIYYDISKNKIEILLPTSLYQQYCNTRVKNAAEVIHASLVMNALTFALLKIEDHESTTWAKTIRYRLENEEGLSKDDIDDPAKIPGLAQKLLKDPYGRLFSKLMENKNVGEE